MSSTQILPQSGEENTSSSLSSLSQQMDSLALNNDSPCDNDLEAIRGFLSNATGRIGFIDKELLRLIDLITKLRTQQEDLTAEKRRLERTVSQSRSLIAPIRRFPVEVLTEMFLHCCDDEDNTAFDLSSGAWLLSHVCRRWRAIVLAIPSLWTSYNFHSPEYCPAGWRQIVTAALNRAGAHSISLTMIDDALDETGGRLLCDWLSFMVEHSFRWRRLSMKFSHSCYLLLEVEAMTPDLPLLTTLSLDFEDLSPFDDADEVDVDAFLAAPELRHVTLRYFGDNMSFALPYSQLLTVDLFTRLPRELNTILDNVMAHSSLLCSLTTGSKESRADFRHDFVPEQPVLLPFLRHLRIEVNGRDEQILITAPMLENLEITLSTDFFLTNLVQFLDRSRAPLQMLLLKVRWRVGDYEFADGFIDWLVSLLLLCISPSLREVFIDIPHPFISTDTEEMVLDALHTQVLPTLPSVIPFTVHLPNATISRSS